MERWGRRFKLLKRETNLSQISQIRNTCIMYTPGESIPSKMKRHSNLTHKVKFHTEHSFILFLLVGFMGLQIISAGTHPEYYEFNLPYHQHTV